MSNILCGLKHYLNYLHYFFFLTPKPFGIEASTMHRLTQLFLIVFHLYVDSESNICWPSNTIMSSSLQKFRIRNGWSMGGILLFLSASLYMSLYSYCVGKTSIVKHLNWRKFDIICIARTISVWLAWILTFHFYLFINSYRQIKAHINALWLSSPESTLLFVRQGWYLEVCLTDKSSMKAH
jgi:hypothetical protein